MQSPRSRACGLKSKQANKQASSVDSGQAETGAEAEGAEARVEGEAMHWHGETMTSARTHGQTGPAARDGHGRTRWQSPRCRCERGTRRFGTRSSAAARPHTQRRHRRGGWKIHAKYVLATANDRGPGKQRVPSQHGAQQDTDLEVQQSVLVQHRHKQVRRLQQRGQLSCRCGVGRLVHLTCLPTEASSGRGSMVSGQANAVRDEECGRQAP